MIICLTICFLMIMFIVCCIVVIVINSLFISYFSCEFIANFVFRITVNDIVK